MECERCRQDFQTYNLRVDTKGGRLVCDNCFNFIKTGTLVPEKTKQEAQKDFSVARRRLALTTSERLDKLGQKKEQYECTSCGFKFAGAPNYDKKCPYCGADSVGPHSEWSPVQEIDEML